MRFHEYVSLRNHWAKQNHDPKMKAKAESQSADEFRKMVLANVPFLMKKPGTYSSWVREQMLQQFVFAQTEQQWVDLDRPYYNVWPIGLSLAESLRLDLPFSSFEFPFSSLLFRFAAGHEPFSVAVAMLHWIKEECRFQLDCWFANSPDAYSIRFNRFTPEDSVEEWLGKKAPFENQWNNPNVRPEFDVDASSRLMLRIAVFVGLLSNNHDLITPIVLAKDFDKYEAADDPAVKKWLEDRAARRGLGRGFDFGRKLQEQKDKSPHWRNPHLCLFWTGPERKKPVIQLRSGSVIQRVNMADVPTGYLGPESEADDDIGDLKTPRESFSKSLRFAIFKRDSYRCQLCGRKQEDGIILHVDHRIPLARGGSNLIENLWTLCDACNLGKSDEFL